MRVPPPLLNMRADFLQWALQSSFPIERELPESSEYASISISWGASEELLVAHSSLELYQTTSAPECSWRQDLANPVRLASLSYDSAYIASVGQYDRLVKVWRRLSYGAGEVRFDFAYLSHPRAVTSVQWRKPHHVDQTIDNVLYTFCADNTLRVWTGSDSHGHMQLWGKLDLASAIQSRAPQHDKPALRWAYILHGRDLSAATEKAVQDGVTAKDDDASAALDHLIAVANRSPEVCVVFDGRGHMAAWAFENVGCKTQKSNIFNVTHVESPEFIFLKGPSVSDAPHVELYSYCNPGGYLHTLFHFFDGKVQIYRSNVASFFDPRPNKKRMSLRSLWTGNSAPIRKIVRNFSGRAIVSRTEEGECVVWKHEFDDSQTMLTRQVVMQHDRHIHRTCLLRKGRFVVFLHYDSISLWDCRPPSPHLLAEVEYKVPGKPLCLLVLPRHKVEDYATAHIATITSEKQGIVWEVKLPFYTPSTGPGVVNGNRHQQPSIAEYVRFTLDDAGDLGYVLPVDPAGSAPVASGFLDVFTRDVAVSYTHSGRVEFWTARVGHHGKGVEWLSTCHMETGVSNPALVSGASKKAALVNSSRSSLTIWGVRGERLEYTQDFENGNTIKDLDWTSTPDNQAILAVGFPHRVLLICEMRFDYLNKGPAWAPIREINIRDLTPHPIGDSTWLGDGNLVIGAGNQVFAYDRQFDASSAMITSLRLPHRKNGKWDIFDAVKRLNGPLPVFHPQFLSQCILGGKTALVHTILSALNKTLKFWIPGEPIDDYLGLPVEDFYTIDHVGTFCPSARRANHLGLHVLRKRSRPIPQPPHCIR